MAFFQSRGMNLHYEVIGAGPAILMIHGFTNHGMVWAEQVADLLHAGYRVVMPDLAGHGLSQAADRKTTVNDLAEDMLALLDHLSIDKTVICGLSLGGMIAQYMAADHPQRVSALVIANSCVDSTGPDVVTALHSWIEMFERPDGTAFAHAGHLAPDAERTLPRKPDGGSVSRKLATHQRQDP